MNEDFSLFGMAKELGRACAIRGMVEAGAFAALALAANRHYGEDADSAMALAWRSCCRVRDAILAERAHPDDWPSERVARWRNAAHDAITEFVRDGLRRREHRNDVLASAHRANAVRGYPFQDAEIERIAQRTVVAVLRRAG